MPVVSFTVEDIVADCQRAGGFCSLQSANTTNEFYVCVLGRKLQSAEFSSESWWGKK